MLPSITPPEPAPTSDLAERSAAIRRHTKALVGAIASCRRKCSDKYYGAGLVTANALFAASEDGGASIVAGDITMRQLAADLIAADPFQYEEAVVRWATGTPLPDDMDLVPEGSGFKVIAKV